MRRLAVLVASAAALIAAAPAAAQSGRTDDATKRVVLLSGSELGTVDCNSLWVPAIDHLAKMRFRIKGVDQKFSGGFVTVSNYDSDHNCDVTLGKGEQMDLAAQAKVFAAWLEKEGRPVDIVAFGTGGLVARVALGMQGTPDWPGPLPVEDVITVGTPHLGSKAIAAACPSRPVCQDLDPDTGSGKGQLAFLDRFQNPLGDWTAIAGAGDELVKPESALGMDADHETTYADAKLTHAKLLRDLASTRNAVVTYQHRGTEIIEWRKAPHLVERIGLNLVYGSDGNDSAPTTQTGCTGYSETPGGATVVRFPGMVGWKGTHDMSYVKNGIMEAYADCLKKVYASKELTSDGPVRVNGLDLTPRPGSVITIDPAKRLVKGDHVNLSIPSQYFGALPVPLRQDAEIAWTLPREAGKLEGNDLDGFTLSGAGKVAGLKLKGSAKLTFIQGGIQLDTNLQLPGLFSADMPTGKAYVQKPQCSDGTDNDNDGKTDTADSNCSSPQDNYEDAADNPGFATTIKSDNVKGLFLDKISGTVEGNIRLGKLELPAMSLSYSLPDNAWTASVTAVLPIPNAPKVKVEGGLKDGQLSKFSVDVTGMNAGPLPANLYLQRVKLGWVREPFEIQFGTGISWDRRYTFPNYGTFAAAEVEGDVSYTETNLKMSGKLLLFGIEWGNGSADWKFGNGVTMNMVIGRSMSINKTYGKTKANLKATLQGTFAGAIDKTGVDLRATGGACFEGSLEFFVYKRDQPKTCLGEASVRGSVKKGLMAFTVCGQVDLGVWAGAIGYGIRSEVDQFGKTIETADVMMGSCDVENWHKPPATAAQAGGAPSVSVGAGVPAEVIAVEGDGAPPRVALRGPGGAMVPPPADASGIVKGDGYMLLHSTADNTTYAIIGKPAAGRWTVEPQPGSALVTDLRAADALPAPSVHASVKGGRLHYDVKAAKGQTVTFKEALPGGGTQTIKTVTAGSGAVKFTPSFGPAGRRSIVAYVDQDGAPRTTIKVATFKAAALRALAAARGVRVVRRGSKLTVTWKKVPGAVKYLVGVKTGDGRSLLFDGKTRRVVVKRMFGTRKSVVTIRAVRADNAYGRPSVKRG